MHRRQFLELATIGCGVLAISRRRRELPESVRFRQLSFYAAGVRFCRLNEVIKEGDTVKVVGETFDKQQCYSIFSRQESRIGYVPRRLLPLLANRTISKAYVSSVKPDAVPWKRFEITILIAA